MLEIRVKCLQIWSILQLNEWFYLDLTINNNTMGHESGIACLSRTTCFQQGPLTFDLPFLSAPVGFTDSYHIHNASIRLSLSFHIWFDNEQEDRQSCLSLDNLWLSNDGRQTNAFEHWSEGKRPWIWHIDIQKCILGPSTLMISNKQVNWQTASIMFK